MSIAEALLLITVPSVVGGFVLGERRKPGSHRISERLNICIPGLEPAPVVLEPVWTFRYGQVFSRTAVLIRFRTRRGNLPRTADRCGTPCHFGRKLALNTEDRS